MTALMLRSRAAGRPRGHRATTAARPAPERIAHPHRLGRWSPRMPRFKLLELLRERAPRCRLRGTDRRRSSSMAMFADAEQDVVVDPWTREKGEGSGTAEAVLQRLLDHPHPHSRNRPTHRQSSGRGESRAVRVEEMGHRGSDTSQRGGPRRRLADRRDHGRRLTRATDRIGLICAMQTRGAVGPARQPLVLALN